jgi:hypothetical protein
LRQLTFLQGGPRGRGARPPDNALPARLKRPPEPEPVPCRDSLDDFLKRTAASQRPLTPAAVIRKNVFVAGLLLSPDRRWLYVLNASERKLQRLDTRTRTVARAAEVPAEVSGMCLRPDGTKLYVAAALPNHPQYLDRQRPVRGQVQEIDPTSLETTGTVTLPYGPFAVAADDKGRLYIAGALNHGTPDGLCVLDAATQARVVVFPWLDAVRVTLGLTPDQQRLYLGTTASNPGQFLCLPLAGDLRGSRLLRDPLEARYDRPSGGRFRITPDGSALAGETGIVLSVSAREAEDRRVRGWVDTGTALAVDGGSPLLLVGTADGLLEVYSLPDCRLRQVHNLGAVFHHLAFDAAARVLYAAAGEDRPVKVRPVRTGGDVVVYDLGPLLDQLDSALLGKPSAAPGR